MYVLSPYCGKMSKKLSIFTWIFLLTEALGKLSAMENVYIRGNVTCNAMSNRETLYNMCELATRWAPGDHDSI